jgi:hypothetical protein
VEVKSIESGILRLQARSKFKAKEISNFERQIVEAWREIDPAARSIKVEFGSPIKSSPSRPEDDYFGF